MKPWVEEVVRAMGVRESHSQPGMAALLAISLGIAIQTVLMLVRDNAAAMPQAEAQAFAGALFLTIAVLANLVAWGRGSSFDMMNRASWGVVWVLVGAAAVAAIPPILWSGMGNAVVMAGLGCIQGASLTFVFLFLGHLFTRIYIPDNVRLSFVAAALGILVASVVMVVITFPASYFVCAALCAANAPIFVVLQRNAPAIGDFEDFRTFRDRKEDISVFLVKVALPLVCLGLTIRLFQMHNDQVTSTLPAPGIMDSVALAVLLFTAFIIVCFAVYGVRSYRWPFTRLFSFFIPMVSLVGIVGIGTIMGSNSPYDGGTLAVFAILLSLIWSFMGSASLEYLLRSASVFGMSLGCLAIGILLGEVLNAFNLFGTPVGAIVASLQVLLMAIGLLPARPAPNLSRSAYAGVSHAEMRAAAVEQTANPVVKAIVDTAPVAEAASDAPTAPAKGRFMRRCDAVSKMFLLSNRESEVLVLLAKGRSMAHIMQELVISEGTAKTHINHVYKKLDVHSRHELLDLIESLELEGA